MKNFPQNMADTAVVDQDVRLEKLFEDELREIYWTEKALIKVLARMVRQATAANLVKVLDGHLVETEEHAARAEEIFNVIGKDHRARKSDTADRLIREADVLTKERRAGNQRDAAILFILQKIERYEILAYKTMKTLAITMGCERAVTLLQYTLDEESANYKKLMTLSATGMNVDVAEIQP
ncbi:YciE/YciF ferroxidase family protein [Chryseolinea lacunae]|uniref:DUF892 family protein n=1 Tax=Chryseolinea lacunae TaxID=2801331 RepID=A0ABS1KYR8_9BACT|nr:DUF892 family protein [Chryseolinea lacunae]MBL0744596.1 DUF892 family protein [Chryseolinea lacunae]